MPDIAASLRARYVIARAQEIVISGIGQSLLDQLQGLQKKIQSATRMGSSATAVAEELRGLAKDVEIDLSDPSIPGLDAEILVQSRNASKAFGMTVEKAVAKEPASAPRGVPTKGMIARLSDRGPAELVDTPPHQPAEPSLRVHAQGEPPPTPPAAKPTNGTVSLVTPRARAALERAKDGARDERGVTHRAEASFDPETGDRIPASEMVVVHDLAPDPGSAAPSGGEDVAPDQRLPVVGDKTPPGTISVPDDPPDDPA